MSNNLKNSWNIWYHENKLNWSISSFKKITNIDNALTFWKIFNNWEILTAKIDKNFFFMKEGVNPIWEDPLNINGGCWSFKIHEKNYGELWEYLSILLVTEEITDNDDIVGLSLCSKKNNFVVIKIWNTNSKNNSLLCLNKQILNKWGTDIIYIAHMPDN